MGGMDDHGGAGDHKRHHARADEIKGAKTDAVGIALQPIVQVKVRHWPGDQVGHQYWDRELPEQDQQYVLGSRTKGFTDANSFGAAFSREGGEPEQPQTSNEDGDAHK